MQTKILSTEQLELLKLIEKSGGLAPFELAGGTALALQLGHRMSIDFDFFSHQLFESSELRTSLDSKKMALQVVQQTPRTLLGTSRGVSFSFFHYDYPLIGTSIPTPWKFNLYSLDDITAMKVEAIAGRGSRKDFVDLWFLCQQGLSLETAFALFAKKFSGTHFDPYHRLRSLAYFDDAEKEPMPRMLKACDWKNVKDFFSAETKKVWGSKLP